MTVTNMSKARPQIDFSLHKAPLKDLYDIQIFFLMEQISFGLG
ncbi:hypothetical protein ACFQEP_02560 [Lactococcus lactis subsp. hordniae]